MKKLALISALITSMVVSPFVLADKLLISSSLDPNASAANQKCVLEQINLPFTKQGSISGNRIPKLNSGKWGNSEDVTFRNMTISAGIPSNWTVKTNVGTTLLKSFCDKITGGWDCNIDRCQ